jgi:hypothetical protein
MILSLLTNSREHSLCVLTVYECNLVLPEQLYRFLYRSRRSVVHDAVLGNRGAITLPGYSGPVYWPSCLSIQGIHIQLVTPFGL